MEVIIGLAVVAGAGFLFWMFIRSRTPASPPQGSTSASSATKSLAAVAANTTLGLGYETAKLGITVGKAVANGAIGLASDAVNASASVLSKTAALGGTVVTDSSKVSSKIVTAGGQVVTAGVKLPIQIVTVQAKDAYGVAKDVGAGVTTVAEKVTGTAAGAVESAGKKVGSTVASAAKSFASLF